MTEQPLSDAECAILLAARRNGDIGAVAFALLVLANPELGEFVAAVARREHMDKTSVAGALSRLGYRVH